MKAILAVCLIVVGIMFACATQAKTLEEVLKGSAPVEKGTCMVEVEKYGVMAVECTKGVRLDGSIIYAIVVDGEIVAVFEDVKDGTPKQIWNKKWQKA